MELLTPHPYKVHRANHSPINILIVGAGGTGGYLIQYLARLLYSYQNTNKYLLCTLIDGDRVEENNLKRQHFIPEDLGKNKATVLTDRFGQIYGIGLDAIPHYLTTPQELTNLCYQNPHSLDSYQHYGLNILVGCVDNHATRQILHQAFSELPSIVYIDLGNDAYDPEEPDTSGYSGHCVVGIKSGKKVIQDPIGLIY